MFPADDSKWKIVFGNWANTYGSEIGINYSVVLTYLYFIYVSEIEAAEACKWLKAAGFPQYAQMYEG